jgi:hypothetical protein
MRLKDTYVLPDAHSCAGAENEEVPVHRLPFLFAHEPSLGPEVICILTKDFLIVVDDCWVHSDTVALGYEFPCRLEALFWCMSLHTQPNTGVHSHGLFDSRADIWQLRGAFGVLDRRTQGAGSESSIDFRMGLCKLLRVSREVVESGTESNRGCV